MALLHPLHVEADGRYGAVRQLVSLETHPGLIDKLDLG